jgi:hypothetical protein
MTYVSELIERKISLLKNEGREKEIFLLLDFFSQAQDLVERVVPFSQDEGGSIIVQILKMETREKLLMHLMGPFLNLEEEFIVFIPISLN